MFQEVYYLHTPGVAVPFEVPKVCPTVSKRPSTQKRTVSKSDLCVMFLWPPV